MSSDEEPETRTARGLTLLHVSRGAAGKSDPVAELFAARQAALQMLERSKAAEARAAEAEARATEAEHEAKREIARQAAMRAALHTPLEGQLMKLNKQGGQWRRCHVVFDRAYGKLDMFRDRTKALRVGGVEACARVVAQGADGFEVFSKPGAAQVAARGSSSGRTREPSSLCLKARGREERDKWIHTINETISGFADEEEVAAMDHGDYSGRRQSVADHDHGVTIARPPPPPMEELPPPPAASPFAYPGRRVRKSMPVGAAGAASAGRRVAQSARVASGSAKRASKIPVPRSLVRHLERASANAQAWRDEAADEAAAAHAQRVAEAVTRHRVLVAERELAAVYEACCPDKAHNVPSLVQRHKADLEGLMVKVMAKYEVSWAVEPPPVIEQEGEEEGDDVAALQQGGGEGGGEPRWRSMTDASSGGESDDDDDDDDDNDGGSTAAAAAPAPLPMQPVQPPPPPPTPPVALGALPRVPSMFMPPPPPPPPTPPPQRVRRASEALESAMHNRANAIEAMSSRGKGKFFFVLRTVGGAHCELGAMSCEACLRAAADKRVRLCKLYTAPTGLVKPRIQARETAEAKLEMYEYDPVLAFASQQAADSFVAEQSLTLAHDD